MRTVVPVSMRAKIAEVLGFGTLVVAVIFACVDVDAHGQSCGNTLAPRAAGSLSECSGAIAYRRYELVILIVIAAGLMGLGALGRVKASSERLAVGDVSYAQPMPTCSGSLVLHAVDGTVVGCTADDERDQCAGRELHHSGDPVPCFVWSKDGGCDRCGVHAAT